MAYSGGYNYQRGFSYDPGDNDGSFFTLDATALTKFIERQNALSPLIEGLVMRGLLLFGENLLIPKLKDYAPALPDEASPKNAGPHLDDTFEVGFNGKDLQITMAYKGLLTLIGRPALYAQPGHHALRFISPKTGEVVFTKYINEATTGYSDDRDGNFYNTAEERMGGGYSREQGLTAESRMTWVARAADGFRRHGYYGTLARVLAEASVLAASGDIAGAERGLEGLITRSALLAKIKEG